MLRTFSTRSGKGRFKIEVRATLTDDGLIVQILGGERPHVGAVVLSLPRQSTSEPGKLRAVSTVIPLYGHRDDEIARPAAEYLATALGQTVVVVAGVHINAAEPEEIASLIKNVNHAVERLTKALQAVICPA
ncbi:MAG: hypothetical protein C4570_01615 [Ammonifex sp.]|jgi:primosomal protein N'|nr:MAG: hypothetical protein C4570_01615 [Ammonifex sp.]